MTDEEKAAFQKLEQRVTEIEASIKSKGAIPFNDFNEWTADSKPDELAKLRERIERLDPTANRFAASEGNNSKLQIGPTPEAMVVIERMQIRILKVIGSVFALIGLTIATILLYSYFTSQ